MSDQTKGIQEIIHTNEALENYFRNTIIPQMYVDGDLILRKFTPPAMKQFNLSDNDIGKSILDIKDNFRYPKIEENIRQVIDSNEILEKEIQTTDLRWYQMNILPYFKKKDKRTDGVVITFVEITMRIQDLKVQEKLIAENTLLLDTISHDLRGPLANLISLIELLKSVPPDDEKERTAIYEIVDSAILHMQQLILDLTNIRKKEFELKDDAELINIEHIMEDVKLSLSENIAASNTNIIMDLKVSEIQFSRRKLRTIMYNLISNGIKFRTPGSPPLILVHAYRHKDFIVLSVRDNGIGIPDNKIESIFLKYGRLDNNIDGSGLGLFLVKEIVTNSGGKIEVESDPDGTEFKIYLKA